MLQIIDEDKDYHLHQEEKTKKTILLCCPEDSEEHIASQIKDDNIDIITSTTGEQCMLSVLSNDVDLVILDQRKAGIKTYDLMNMIQSYNPELPVILICSADTHHCGECIYRDSRILGSEIDEKLNPYVKKLLDCKK